MRRKVKEKLTYKLFKDCSTKEMLLAVNATLGVKRQKVTDCKFGFNDKGELKSVLDFKVLSDIFSV